MESSIRALHKGIVDWLAGPTGALIFHVLLLLALLLWVDFAPMEGPDTPLEFVYVDTVPPPLDPDPPPDILPRPRDWEEIVPTVTPPDVSPDLPEPPEVLSFTPNEPPLAPEPALLPADSPVIMTGFLPGAWQGRIDKGAHDRAGKNFGGPGWEYAEAAVARALEWLRRNQNPDGSWGNHDPEAMTGLGLLTFLAHGETTSSDEYGATVERAIRYLLARQNEQGEFARIDTTAGTYAQAICVYAVSEAYGMTRIPTLQGAMERGVQVILAGQQPKGGFDYKFARGDRRDTSLGGWCCQAMKAAYIAGAENPGLHDAMELAIFDLKSVQKPDDGSFYYSQIGRSHATEGITAAAVLSLQLLEHGGDAETRRGLDFLVGAQCDWQKPPAWPMYAWYYISQTKFHKGGAAWAGWNAQFAPQFIRHQNPDGSWNSAGLALKEGTTGRENMHPVYATTLAALTLQVYYRNLPTYKPIQVQKPDQKSADDVRIQVM